MEAFIEVSLDSPVKSTLQLPSQKCGDTCATRDDKGMIALCPIDGSNVTKIQDLQARISHRRDLIYASLFVSPALLIVGVWAGMPLAGRLPI